MAASLLRSPLSLHKAHPTLPHSLWFSALLPSVQPRHQCRSLHTPKQTLTHSLTQDQYDDAAEIDNYRDNAIDDAIDDVDILQCSLAYERIAYEGHEDSCGSDVASPGCWFLCSRVNRGACAGPGLGCYHPICSCYCHCYHCTICTIYTQYTQYST
jgi:hypothetical protein